MEEREETYIYPYGLTEVLPGLWLADDTTSEDLLSHFDEAFEFIENALQKGSFLWHLQKFNNCCIIPNEKEQLVDGGSIPICEIKETMYFT
ncbi:hypothetical protein RUM44_013295 [Polyplax serrata]|uniref:Uncharacterized protein n=1 Tax=Polyplax serrata TaxID=468196 RepID=A0ABR1BDQ9_POLSC